MRERDVPANASTADAHTRSLVDDAQAAPPSERPTVAGGGAPMEPAGSSFSPGAQVGRYQIMELIGEGGMGRVLRAHDTQLGRDVALKVVSRPTRYGRARLLREARALARIAHPNVVPIFDVGTVGDDIYMAMELVDGCNAEQWLRTPRTWQQVLDVYLDAGRGLRAVHAAGIIHRDFKPQNVVIGSDGRARVTDFGLALREDNQPASEQDDAPPTADHPRLTVTGTIVGTPAYMAPEQAIAGEILDHRTDQFGFCVSLFEAVFGTHPFKGTTSEQLLDSIARREVRKVDLAHVPGAVMPILLRGLDPDPRRRWPGMDQLLSALAGCRARSPRRLAVPLLLSLAVVAGGVGLWIWSATPDEPASRTRRPTPANGPVVARVTRITSGSACEEYPAFSPDNRLIAFDSDRLGDWEIFMLDRSTKQLQQVTREPGWDYMARFSPDGARLAYLHQDEKARELRVIRLDDGDLRSQSLGEAMGSFDWLDSSTLLTAGPSGSLVRIGLDGARAEHLRLADPKYITAVRHHRGDLGLMTDPWLAPHLLLLRGDAAPRELTPRRAIVGRNLAWSPRGDGFYFTARNALASPSLYWRAFDASEEVAIESPHPGDGLDVAADGSALVMSSCSVRLRLVRLRPGQPAQPLFAGHDWDEFEPAPAARGQMLITSTRNSLPELLLVDLATGEGSSVSPPWARNGTISPDGTRIAYLLASPTGGKENGLWVEEIASGKRRQLSADDTDQLPAFSHDGRWIYVLRGDTEQAQVHRVPVDGGAAVPVTPPGAVGYGVSPTADELVYLQGPRSAARLHRGRAAGSFRLIESLPAARYSMVRFSPDGQKVVLRREPSDLVELTLARPEPRVVRSAPEIMQDEFYALDGDGFIATLYVQKGNLFLLEGTFP